MGFDNWELRLKNTQGGCATYLVAAFDPTISGKCSREFPNPYVWSGVRGGGADERLEYNGGYLEDCNIVRTLKPWAADPGAAERLWKMSEEMVGEKFDF